MPERQDDQWGPARHRADQLKAWASASPARRFAWLEEMLDWLRRRARGDVGGTSDPDRDRG